MVRWNKDLVIDLACTGSLTIPEIAERIGVSAPSVERFLSRNRAEVDEARAGVQIPERLHAEVLGLWGESVGREEIARRAGLSVAVVRRLILAAEIDEEPEELGASLELMALQMAHPGRLYEDDVRALHEYAGGLKRITAPDAGLRQAGIQDDIHITAHNHSLKQGRHASQASTAYESTGGGNLLSRYGQGIVHPGASS